MSGFLDTLNLRPQERRFVVVVAVIVFVVLNLWLVWPHFSDWNRLTGKLGRIRADIEKYNKEIAKDENPADGFRKQLAALQKQEGNKVLMSEQNQLEATVRVQSNKAGVTVGNFTPDASQHGGPTNEFFEEQSLRITTDSDEAQLVNFLYQVGTDSSMIRVRDLELKPMDQNRYRLRGMITLTANYQKKPPGAAAPAAKTPPRPGTAAKPPPLIKRPPPIKPPFGKPPGGQRPIPGPQRS